MNNEQSMEERFDAKFDNYAYIAELYVEAQMGDLSLLSMKDFIRTEISSARADEAAKCRKEERERIAEGVKDLGEQQDDDTIWCNMDSVLSLLSEEEKEV